jgi:hypothetical protein
MKKRWILLVVLITSVLSISFAKTESLFSTPNTPPKEAPAAVTPTATAAPAASASSSASAPAATVSSSAAATETASSANKSGFEKFRDWFHNPTPWLEMGADLRVRYTYGWNLDTLNDHPWKTGTAKRRESKYSWYQQRMKWGMKFKLTDDVDFNLKYNWEFRAWDEPSRKNANTDYDEVLWESFNLVVRNFGGMPLTMTLGRQDIMLGAGWLIADATPLDAARTAYFDALRFTYQVRDKTTLDLIYMENRASTDAYLRPFSEGGKEGTEQDETAFIAYLTDKTNPNLNMEGYYIYKKDSRIDTLSGVPLDRDRWPAIWSKEAEISTIGGALSGNLFGSEHWKYRTEGAVQFGEKEGINPLTNARTGVHKLMAFGANNKLEYHFNDPKKNRVRLTYEYRSGDKPGTGKIEAFDPLWGEYPQWGDLSNYMYNLETMIGEVTNLHRLGIGHSIQLTKVWELNTDLYWLFADENTRGGYTHGSGLGFSQNGGYRGTLAVMMLKYNMTKNLSGHIEVDYFQPGNYYTSGSRDAATFFRANMDYKF